MGHEEPYTKTFELEAHSGEDNFFTLKMPNRGTLALFNLQQVTGALAGFSADLYFSKRALPAVEVSELSSGLSESFNSSSSAVLAQPPTQRDIYRIILPTPVAASDVAAIALADANYPYRNIDGTYSVPIRLLYLRINPAGSGFKAFQLALTVRMTL